MASTHPPARRPGVPPTPNTSTVAGYTVAARGGRVWLHPAGQGDGDLPAELAWELASAIHNAAGEADQQELDAADAAAAAHAEAEVELELDASAVRS